MQIHLLTWVGAGFIIILVREERGGSDGRHVYGRWVKQGGQDAQEKVIMMILHVKQATTKRFHCVCRNL